MGRKLLAVGFVWMLALPSCLRALGLTPNTDLIVAVGGIIAVIGCVLYCLDR